VARYGLLETIREYAQEKLLATGTSERSKGRHADYFLALAEKAEPLLRGSNQLEWLETLEEEHANLRVALKRFADVGNHEGQTRLASALWRYCYLRGHYGEGRLWLQDALVAHGTSPEVRAHALEGAGALALYQCDYDQAEQHCRASHELYREIGDKRGIASGLTFLGGVARERADYDRCLSLHAEALQTFRELGDDWGAAHSVQLSGFASWLRLDLDAAETLSEQATTLFAELNDKERKAWALMDLGAVAHYRGDRQAARRLLQGSLRSFEDVGFKEGVAWCYNLLALVDIELEDHESARVRLCSAFALHRELGDRWRLCSVLEALAAVAVRTGAAEPAAALLARAERLRATIGAPIPPAERKLHDDTAGRLRARLDDEAFERARERGRAMTLDEAYELASIGAFPKASAAPSQRARVFSRG
jgi:tetratricopeptide (TPR) repeat protein